MRVVFMATPGFALPTLNALHAAGHDIAAIYTQPPRPAGRGQKESSSPVHQFAIEHGLSVYTPVSLKSPEALAEFTSHKADIAVVVAYGLLLPKPILEAYPLGCINVHPSKLPRWRGAAPLQRTIMAGDRETSICIMQMDEGLDTGDILLEKNLAIPEGMNAGALHDWLAADAAPMVLETLAGLNNKTITPRPQPSEGLTYAKKITKEECSINWSATAASIYQQILGLSPSPGASFVCKGEIIKIFSARVESQSGKNAGTITDEKFGIGCGDGILYPTELQRPGKKRMALADFLNGFEFSVGDRVG